MSENFDIYEMKLHDMYRVNNSTVILRVPGGWIYKFIGHDHSVCSCFVPFGPV